MPGAVLFGVAGWSYPDWRGVVYPRGCRDELRYLARHVDLIEINTTFYRVPEPDAVAAWVERTRDVDLSFTAKLPQAVTHGGVPDAGTVRDFAACVAPLRDARRLLALLAQFSFRFVAGREAYARLDAIARAFGGLAPLVLEVRHPSWAADEAQRAAAAAGFTIAQLDYPGGYDGRGAAPRGLAYLRAHGRNRAAWFRKDAGRDEVYDWEYTASERLELAERVHELAAATRTLVVANNHFQGKAVKLALELRAAHEDGRVAVPDPLLAAYPELGGIARGVLF